MKLSLRNKLYGLDGQSLGQHLQCINSSQLWPIDWITSLFVHTNITDSARPRLTLYADDLGPLR